MDAWRLPGANHRSIRFHPLPSSEGSVVMWITSGVVLDKEWISAGAWQHGVIQKFPFC